MAVYILPDTVHGGSIQVSGNSLAEAQQNAATQSGASLSQQQGGGTYGSNTFGGGGTSSPGSVNTGGASTLDKASAARLDQIQQQLNQAIASGNKAFFDEAVRQYNSTFGLDTQKFQETVRQYNQSFGLTEAGVTGTYQGKPTLAAQQQQFSQGLAQQQLGLNALQLAVQQQANPFRQAEALYGASQQGLSPLMASAAGAAGPLPSFSAPSLSAADTRSLDWLSQQGGTGSYVQNQANNFLGGLKAPNQTNWTNVSFATPGAQNLVVQGLAQKYGLNEADIQAIAKATMPAFSAPTLAGATHF